MFRANLSVLIVLFMCSAPTLWSQHADSTASQRAVRPHDGTSSSNTGASFMRADSVSMSTDSVRMRTDSVRLGSRVSGQSGNATSAEQRAMPVDVYFFGNSSITTSELQAGIRGIDLSDRALIIPRIRDAIVRLYTARGYLTARVDSAVIEVQRDSSQDSQAPGINDTAHAKVSTTNSGVAAGGVTTGGVATGGVTPGGVAVGASASGLVSSRILVRVHLTEGPPARIGVLTLEGNAAIPSPQLLKECDLTPGSLFSPAALNADIARILALYDRRGYPFAAVEVRDVHARIGNGDVLADVVLGIDQGTAVRIDELSVEGNALTSADVIVRETRIAVGDTWDAEKTADVRRRLERLGFFSNVADPELYLRGDRAGLLIRVTEGATNHFDGVIGYQPARQEGGAGTLTGLVNLSFRNIFGTGRRFDARWERAASNISELELRYLEPWVFGFPVNAQGGFAQRLQDSTYVRRVVDAKLTWLASGGFQISGLFSRMDVIPARNAGGAAPTASASTTAGAELAIDTRDNTYNPFSGYQIRNSWNAGIKRTATGTGGTESDVIQRIELDATLYQETLPRTVLALALHGRELRGASVDLADVYRLGGANTLRGYREEQFTGMRLAWSSIEMRYSLGRRSFAFVFFDLGYIYQPARGSTLTAFRATRHGYGVGARIETGLGILGVSYALGQGDSFSTGKIHFGLINEF